MVDTLVFIVAAAICLTGALGVILARNPVHSALMLVMTLFGIAVLFVAQEAHFLAAVQVIVYAGAIVVLFLFVIMLLGVDRAQNLELSILPIQRWAALAHGSVLTNRGSDDGPWGPYERRQLRYAKLVAVRRLRVFQEKPGLP